MCLKYFIINNGNNNNNNTPEFMKIIINNKQRRARDTVKDIWPQMTIDTRGPARRRETVRDKNAKRRVNGKRIKREERRTRQACRRTKKKRRKQRRPSGMRIGGARCETTTEHEVYRGWRTLCQEAKWSAATDRVCRLPNVEYSQCSLLTTVDCSGHTSVERRTLELPATAYSASTRHSLPPLFPPIHVHCLAAHPPVRTVLSIWARIVLCAAAS